MLHIVKVFGAAGDQLTRYMYTLGSSSKATGEVVTLLDMARQEVSPPLSLSQASLVPSLTQMAKRESSGKVAITIRSLIVSFLIRHSYMRKSWRRRTNTTKASYLPHLFRLEEMTSQKGEETANQIKTARFFTDWAGSRRNCSS